MIIRHVARSLTLLCLLVATPSLSMAAESITERPRRPPIRSTDRRLRSLEDENRRLRELVVEQSLDIQALRAALEQGTEVQPEDS